MSQNRNVYLDYAAATPLDEVSKRAMEPYFNEQFYNPSAIYSQSKKIKSDLESFRQKIAEIIAVKKNEIIFTAGATEANNLAVFGSNTHSGHIVTTAIEHDSILKPVQNVALKGVNVTYIKPDEKGIVSADEVIGAVNGATVLVSVIMANNEIGTIQPISKIAEGLAKIKKQRQKGGNKLPLLFHTDAAQAVNYLDIHPKRLGVDLMSFNASKIYGPKQIGALYINSHAKLNPLILGGGQEKGYRSGTENVAYIAGFAAAIEKTSKIRKTESERLVKLQKRFIDSLKANFKIRINGSLKRRLPNNLHITFEGVDNERLLYELDEMGVYAASGSACSEASDEPSHVLSAIGLSEHEARSSIRFTLGRQTNEAEVDYTVDCLKKILKV